MNTLYEAYFVGYAINYSKLNLWKTNERKCNAATTAYSCSTFEYVHYLQYKGLDFSTFILRREELFDCSGLELITATNCAAVFIQTFTAQYERKMVSDILLLACTVLWNFFKVAILLFYVYKSENRFLSLFMQLSDPMMVCTVHCWYLTFKRLYFK